MLVAVKDVAKHANMIKFKRKIVFVRSRCTYSSTSSFAPARTPFCVRSTSLNSGLVSLQNFTAANAINPFISATNTQVALKSVDVLEFKQTPTISTTIIVSMLINPLTCCTTTGSDVGSLDMSLTVMPAKSSTGKAPWKPWPRAKSLKAIQVGLEVATKKLNAEAPVKSKPMTSTGLRPLTSAKTAKKTMASTLKRHSIPWPADESFWPWSITRSRLPQSEEPVKSAEASNGTSHSTSDRANVCSNLFTTMSMKPAEWKVA
mmetsp:Transcript_102286/g.259788  ORF Transcript_102286/g.259788 Transcript_102286/m.259788 type:complete len:261 (+) Transcript_102286:867-1649(+)